MSRSVIKLIYRLLMEETTLSGNMSGRGGLRDEGSVYLLLNDIHPSGIQAVVDVFVMRDDKENMVLPGCLNACFSFQGGFGDYDSYVYDVNVNGLAHHGLHRLSAIRDFEIIQRKQSDIYFLIILFLCISYVSTVPDYLTPAGVMAVCVH
ncbi:hypothetical protein RCM47_03205 [Escherichia coli]|nr:hypothetical protein [Escherichia coli]